MRNALRNTALSFLGSVLTLCPAQPACAAATTDPYESKLLGDAGGVRSRLDDAGVDVTVEYKADVMSDVSGGIKRGANYLDNLDIKFDLDGEKLFGIEGNKALIYFVNNAGGKPNEHRVGSTQGVDNIEVETNTFALDEAWIEQSFFDKKLSVLVGLADLNDEFDETDMTANFLLPTMQIGQAFAQTGWQGGGPSTFPFTGVGGRVKVSPTTETYLSVAAFDAVPENPLHFYGTVLVAEAGMTPPAPEGTEGAPNKFAVGGWMYTHKMNDLVEVDANGAPVKARQAGAYFLSSYEVYHDKQTGHGLGLFFRSGVAEGDTAHVDWDYELGATARGWLPKRPNGEFGLGLSQAHNSDKYMQSVGGEAERSEYSFELYYRDQIGKGISIQPDVQYVINPGTDRAVSNATILGIRLDINL